MPSSRRGLLFIVSAASRSLRAVARDVAARQEGDLADVAVARMPEEIAPLVTAFNSLLRRLRNALSTQRRFMQDAAHELRTPMAAIGLQIENLRAHVPAGDAAERFAQLESGVKRAQHLIEQLLRLSRQDAPATGARGPVDVAVLLRDSGAAVCCAPDLFDAARVIGKPHGLTFASARAEQDVMSRDHDDASIVSRHRQESDRSWDATRVDDRASAHEAARPAKPLVVIYAADLEAAQRAVEQAGGKITRPVFSFPGGRRFQFIDPSGNELAVWSE